MRRRLADIKKHVDVNAEVNFSRFDGNGRTGRFVKGAAGIDGVGAAGFADIQRFTEFDASGFSQRLGALTRVGYGQRARAWLSNASRSSIVKRKSYTVLAPASMPDCSALPSADKSRNVTRTRLSTQ